MDSWQVDLISSSFILLALKPEIRIIPVFFLSILFPYVVNSVPVNFLPGSALISFCRTLGMLLGDSPRLGAKLGVSLLIDSILGILFGAALGDVMLFGHDLGESPMLGVSLSPS